MARWSFNVGGKVATTIYFDEPSNACWFGSDTGDLQVFTVLGQTTKLLGSGWNDAVSVLPSVDGLTLVVVVAAGDIFIVARDRADRADATAAASIGIQIMGADRLGNGDVVALDVEGRVHQFVPSSGELAVLVDQVPDATHLIVDDARGELIVAVSGATSLVHRFDAKDGTSLGLPTEVTSVITAITTAAAEPGVLIADDNGNISPLLWSGAVDPFTVTAGAVTALCRWHSLVMIAVDDTLDLVEWGADVETLPVSASLDPLVIAGWAALNVDYGAAGIAPGDVEWSVREGPYAGTISVARPSDQSANRYEHRVIAGAEVPEFTVQAIQQSSGELVATRRFRVAQNWPNNELGPPMAVTGSRQVYRKPGWGGGPAGPQNINKHPAPEEIRIAVVVFRTKGSTSTVDAAARIAELKKTILDPGLSVKTYFEEVSYRTTPASANPNHPKGSTIRLLGDQVFGPIDLTYSWGDLFYPSDRTQPWNSWDPGGNTWDLLGGAFSTLIVDRGLSDSVTRLADAVIFMMLPGTDDPYMVGTDSWSAQWSWASAWEAQHYWKTQFSTTFTRLPSVVMPAAFPKNHPSPWSQKEWVSTICHELSHTLGCPDLYNQGAFPAEMSSREVGAWDLMASDAPLPHFSLVHRMRLGWISPDWIEVCDFGQNPASRTIILQAAESLTRSGPPAGRKAGVEIRIRDGWNYYFEYRRPQASQIGDRALPGGAAILGTDLFQAGANDVARALILLLPNDADGDGPVLRRIDSDYEESDVTNPDRMNNFSFKRKSSPIFDSNAMTVQIDYVGAHAPELQIAPAPGWDKFKSPDINVDGPAGPNVVVKGKLNVVRVTVHNKGTKAADKVQIHAKWLPFTTAPGKWNPLADPPTQPIPAKSSRVFIINWQLNASVMVGDKEAEHFCVRVDIDRYVDPTDPAGNEIVVHNNWAQSNFSTSAVGQSSPSERRSTPVIATNIFPMRAVHRTMVEQSSEHFRTYVDHAWRRLEPDETDVTQVSYESLAGDPLHGRDFEIAFRETHGERTVNDLVLRTFAMPERVVDGPIERWGAQLLIQAGIRTFIPRLHARGELVEGVVRAGDDDNSFLASGGTVRVVAWPRERPDQQEWTDGSVQADGSFRVGLPGRIVAAARQSRILVMAFYHGTTEFTPCKSDEVRLEVG